MSDWPQSYPFESSDGVTESDLHHLSERLRSVPAECRQALAEPSPFTPLSITRQVQERVTYCEAPAGSECHQTILGLVDQADDYFCASFESGSLPSGEFFNQVRAMGQRQASGGLPRAAISSAIKVASLTAWSQLGKSARSRDIPRAQYYPALDYLFTLAAFVSHQANAGFGFSDLSTEVDLTPAAIFEAVGRNLRTHRERLGLTQQQLADLAGFNRSLVDGLETGQRDMSLSSLDHLAAILNVDASELLQD